MNYAAQIKESSQELANLMSAQKLTLSRDRLQYLYLLKTGQAKTQIMAGSLIGLKDRQSQKLWQLYRQGGLDTLLNTNRKTYFGKLSCQQISILRVFLATHQANSLADIQTWLKTQQGVSYTLGGISLLCKRLKIKHKTGRPTNVRQDKEGMEDFKKNFIR